MDVVCARPRCAKPRCINVVTLPFPLRNTRVPANDRPNSAMADGHVASVARANWFACSPDLRRRPPVLSQPTILPFFSISDNGSSVPSAAWQS